MLFDTAINRRLPRLSICQQPWYKSFVGTKLHDVYKCASFSETSFLCSNLYCSLLTFHVTCNGSPTKKDQIGAFQIITCHLITPTTINPGQSSLLLIFSVSPISESLLILSLINPYQCASPGSASILYVDASGKKKAKDAKKMSTAGAQQWLSFRQAYRRAKNVGDKVIKEWTKHRLGC